MADLAQDEGVSTSLGPLREVVASLTAARDGEVPSGNLRRRLVRRGRSAGVAAIPALVRALGSRQGEESRWANYLLGQLGGERVVARLRDLLADPRAPEAALAPARSLLAKLGDPADQAALAAAIPTQRRDLSVAASAAVATRHRADGVAAGQRRIRRRARRGQPIEVARGLLDGGRLGEARILLESLSTENPLDGEVASLLGVCALELGDARAALLHCERAALLEPGEALHHWNLAAAARAGEQLVRCFAALRRYLTLADRSAAARARRAAARSFIKQYERSLQGAWPGRGIPDLVVGEELFRRAFEALEQGRYGEAAEGFERVLAILPDHYPSWGNLGAARFAEGQREEAERCFHRALAVNPGYDVAIDNLQAIEGQPVA